MRTHADVSPERNINHHTPVITTNPNVSSTMLRASLSRLASRARFPQQQQLRQCQTSAASTTAASAAPTKRTVSFGSRLMAQYEAALEAQPLITKSVTSGVLYGVGDWVAQTVEQRRASSSENEQPKPFDSARWARAMVFGGIFYPGVAHLHYNFLENLVVARWAVAPSRVPFVKMFIEQFVYWSYFSNAYYHAVLGALQGMTVEQVCIISRAPACDVSRAHVRTPRRRRSRIGCRRRCGTR